MTQSAIVGGIELGGTKTVLAVGHVDGTIIDCHTVPTEQPPMLLEAIAAYFSQQARNYGAITAIGAGAFGPIVLDRTAKDFGHLLQTNKPGWSGFALHSALTDATGVPISLVTDVGAAGIGEAHMGSLRNTEIGIYLTIGTGIGGAILCHGKPLPALLHPELGHIPVQRLSGDTTASLCRFHQQCAEGLAAGPAIVARFGRPLNLFAGDGPEIGLVADYIGQLCASLTFTLSPQRIVIGGGVAKTPYLIPQIRARLRTHLAGYGTIPTDDDSYITSPALGDRSGITGALIAATL